MPRLDRDKPLLGRMRLRNRVCFVKMPPGEREMDVIAAIHGRRSVRSYDPRPVERELIEGVIEDAAQAPPPFRGQVPWAFNVVQGVERIAAYGARVMDYTKQHRRDEPGRDWLDRPGFKIF